MINIIKWFVYETFDKDGKVSAPQLTGFIMSILGCILTILHYQTSSIIPVFSTAMALLGISGTVEVCNSKKHKDDN